MKIIQSFLNEENLFKDAMSDVREKGKDYIKKLSKAKVKELESKLKADLERKYIISNLDMKLGRFRGMFFVTSCKISAKPKSGEFESEEDAKELEEFLQTEYSPKFKLKSVSDGIANLNVR